MVRSHYQRINIKEKGQVTLAPSGLIAANKEYRHHLFEIYFTYITYPLSIHQATNDSVRILDDSLRIDYLRLVVFFRNLLSKSSTPFLDG